MAFIKLSRPSLILRLLLGGWLALLSQSNLAYAQINHREVFIAQRSVYDGVPPAPPSSEPLPAVPSNSEGYTVPEVNTPSQRSVEFQAEPSRYNRDYTLYKVYVNDSGYGLLQRIRRISPRAFRRQFRGRSVIQVGAFDRKSNAQNLVRNLESYGIYSARVVSSDRIVYNGRDGRDAPDDSGRGDNGRERSNYYYVVIPAKAEDLPYYRNEIRRYVGRNVYVIPRLEPRGPHVAVGPFVKRSQAEEWNSYLRRDSRFGNARVYYGK
ncbi:MAG: SPOR domain-containing protein [Iphinoe sp. HA4291-MV1]|nr:SPOR domain-containing protein [Iphinoe sp. HA4291-MV1]